ncbi:hypothetical protein AQUSIP_19600 [Aquicella siphonis]|uniref:Glycosyltransferase RgtA/B/C/D-like domain-containing protein n=1 Tax=Aquicella siphonis TaxID=254247 RepID=A0A5E4PJM9_9COXI|nr:glycosyltransferase family 39 protein [Aquicella siphonis]VVC76637.1 hypothetical protein AQUSIP_19600 [Aquicella siphonis]
MLAAYRNTLESLIIFCLGLILFVIGSGSREILGFDSRFYLFALEMWRYGTSWFPMTYHLPYPDYPAASTLLIYLSARLLGGVSKLSAVLPSAVLAAATLVLTYRIGSQHSRRFGWCAVFFLLLTLTFIKSARSIALDMYPTVICAGVFYLIYSADRANHPNRGLWVYPLLFLGFAFRGPIGLVMPAGVICAYYLQTKNIRKLLLSGFAALLLLFVCTAALLVLARHTGGDIFMREVMRMEVLGRMDNPYLPVYFYFTDSFGSYALAYPVACLVLPGVAYYFSRESSSEMKLVYLLFGWMAIILAGMSIPDDKKVRYILPMLPAAALIASYPFIAPARQRYFVLLRKALARVFLVLPLLFFLGVLFIRYDEHAHSLSLGIRYTVILVLLSVLQVISLILFYAGQFRSVREPGLLCVSALSFIFTFLYCIEPIQLYFDKARDFVQAVEAKRNLRSARLVFYREKPDGLPIKYLINMNSLDQPEFIDNESALMRFAPAAFFVTSQAYYDALPVPVAARFRIIAKNRLGHVPVVVFTNREGLE